MRIFIIFFIIIINNFAQENDGVEGENWKYMACERMVHRVQYSCEQHCRIQGFQSGKCVGTFLFIFNKKCECSNYTTVAPS
uniref:Knottin scorpion toxin-like domain-containing protein n=1 Tax=Strongyloides venezuelensis TaxID=75913 RepID=A0A0K0G695_STRVS